MFQSWKWAIYCSLLMKPERALTVMTETVADVCVADLRPTVFMVPFGNVAFWFHFANVECVILRGLLCVLHIRFTVAVVFDVFLFKSKHQLHERILNGRWGKRNWNFFLICFACLCVNVSSSLFESRGSHCLNRCMNGSWIINSCCCIIKRAERGRRFRYFTQIR